MTSNRDSAGRDILPIPDSPFTASVTNDARNPDTAFPPVGPVAPDQGRRPL